MELLQPGAGPVSGRHYLGSTVDTASWGWLPGEDTPPRLSIYSGETVTVDTVSHEGILEDQGRDPVAFFAGYGVPPGQVLDDAREIARDHPERDPRAGPHVVTGPVHVRGARGGDVLRVDVLELQPRAPYGLISSRHGLGALPKELPDPEGPPVVSTFCRAVCGGGGPPVGIMSLAGGGSVHFPLAPFLGLMGVTAAGPPRHSVPPGPFGGNVDVNLLGAGSTLYLPVQIDGAGFYAGDPHFAQGDGEVALTALEAPLRATLRLTTLSGPAAFRLRSLLGEPVGETPEHWLLLGLDVDLGEALRRAVRNALAFLVASQAMTATEAYAYLSAAADFEVSQVVDQIVGVHCLIRKADFAPW